MTKNILWPDYQGEEDIRYFNDLYYIDVTNAQQYAEKDLGRKLRWKRHVNSIGFSSEVYRDTQYIIEQLIIEDKILCKPLILTKSS